MINAWIDESVFSFEEMEKENRESMKLDGIGDVKDGRLYYTGALIQKCKKIFGIELPEL